jgi:hypothetical protein
VREKLFPTSFYFYHYIIQEVKIMAVKKVPKNKSALDAKRVVKKKPKVVVAELQVTTKEKAAKAKKAIKELNIAPTSNRRKPPYRKGQGRTLKRQLVPAYMPARIRSATCMHATFEDGAVSSFRVLLMEDEIRGNGSPWILMRVMKNNINKIVYFNLDTQDYEPFDISAHKLGSGDRNVIWPDEIEEAYWASVGEDPTLPAPEVKKKPSKPKK